MMQQRPGSKRRGAVTITCVSVLLLVGVLTAGVLLLVFKPAQGPQQGAPYASKSTGAGKQAAGRKQEPVLDLFTVAKALDPEVGPVSTTEHHEKGVAAVGFEQLCMACALRLQPWRHW
jgi:hypothetical protein